MPEPPCAEEIFLEVPARAPAVRLIPPAAPFFSLEPLLVLFRAIFAFIRGGTPVYVKAASRVLIVQVLLPDTTKFTNFVQIPADALSWELWNSTLGSATGTLQWGYETDPGVSPTGRFNQIDSNQRVVRAIADVPIYVKPASANQVVVIEIVRP